MSDGITHGLQLTTAVQLNFRGEGASPTDTAELVEIRGHATMEKAVYWRDGGFSLQERKQDIMESLPDAMWKELLGYIRRGYGLRVVVIQPSHLPSE